MTMPNTFNNKDKDRRYLAYWLFFSCFMVAAMAVIGAITRLTESGLSMVEWRPLIGAIPPLSETEWNRVFELYRQTPEYQQINAGMSLSEFKLIFFWEWFHRLWGRVIGLVYAVPLIFFWVKGMIPKGYKSRLLIGLALGAGQAVMGWYMVESGLVDRPDVSHYRLAAHLSLAFIIFGYLFWVGLSLIDFPRKIQVQYTFCRFRHALVSLAFLAITIVWGAFVAGLDAGLIYNSWPLMGGQFLPPESVGSIVEDHAWVQFSHRWIAALTFILIASLAWRLKSLWLMAAVTAQFALGVLTLLSALYIPLATLHQLGALTLLAILLFQIYGLNRKRVAKA